MLQRLSVDELKPGMYVASVNKQTGKIEVLSQGWVRTKTAIAALKARGILEVTIDPDKTLRDLELDVPADISLPASAATAMTAPVPKASLEQELQKASQLYEEAKQLQQKALDDLRSGKPPQLEPVQRLASGMMESLFRNQDALLCMTRMRDKDAYLLEHSVNVSILMTVFARQLGIDENLIQELATGALLHDIGKILVPGAVLNKAGKLSETEMQEMRRHVEHGLNTLAHTQGLSELAREVVAQHHERLSGNGYPMKLGADQISRAGRMIAIVDTYDAITATRVYKDGNTPVQAFKILREESGLAYDAALVTEFIRALGVYPVGSMVRLKSGRVGLVLGSNEKDPLRPTVKVFYHSRLKQQIPISNVDLASKQDDEIEASVRPEQYKIDMLGFFRHAVLGR